MIFNSFPFLIFFAVFLVAYWNLAGRQRLLLCLVGSYFFYGWWNWYLLSLIVFSTVVDFLVGLSLSQTDTEPRRRLLLIVSLACNLGVLGFFKYCNFFAESLNGLASQFGWALDWPTLNIVLPVGISFYTFQSLSYTIDVYRRKIPHEPDFVRFSTFVAFFPQLVAGPIVRASEFIPQLQSDREYRWSDTVDGFGQTLLGFFKKVVIADTIAIVVDPMYDQPEGYGCLNVILLSALFAIQIYCDFSGYSDIAIGTARMLGFRLPKNFDRPFFAASITDFWRRWHITLSTWLRDYVYIPLGGNRGTRLATSRNLFLTMLIGGLWHGAAWTYVVWGAFFGILLVVEREIIRRNLIEIKSSAIQSLIQLVKPFLVFAIFAFSMIIFRSDNFGQAMTVLSRIASLEGLSASALHNRIPLIKAMALASVLMSCELLWQFGFVQRLFVKASVLRPIVYACLIWSIALFGTFEGNAFVYFQF